MTYEALWKRLTPLYEAGEAKAIARWMLDVRFGLTMADILCGKVEELSEAAQAELKAMTARLAEGEPVQYVVGSLFGGPGISLRIGELVFHEE